MGTVLHEGNTGGEGGLSDADGNRAFVIYRELIVIATHFQGFCFCCEGCRRIR